MQALLSLHSNSEHADLKEHVLKHLSEKHLVILRSTLTSQHQHSTYHTCQVKAIISPTIQVILNPINEGAYAAYVKSNLSLIYEPSMLTFILIILKSDILHSCTYWPVIPTSIK